MIVKVILVVSLLKICVGDSHSHSHAQSNQAVSSQSFVRHDVPLSYQYSAVHVYTTPKPDQERPKPVIPQHLVRPQLPKEIQYAPIYNAHTDQRVSYEKPGYSENTAHTENYNVINAEKTHLEPKTQSLHNVQHQQEHLSYVPGYNIELLQAVNRYPGHNAVYRSYPNMASNDKINKVNFLKQYILYQKPEEQYATAITEVNHPTPQMEHLKATLSPFVPKQETPTRQIPQVYSPAHIATVKAVPSVQSLLALQELIPHPKAHRMLLNIARTYNIAGNAQKAQHASLTMLKNVPAHTQAIIHIPNPANIEQNTRLLPLPNKQMRQLAHRLS